MGWYSHSKPHMTDQSNFVKEVTPKNYLHLIGFKLKPQGKLISRL